MNSYFGGKMGIKVFLAFVVFVCCAFFMVNEKSLVFNGKMGEYTFYTYSMSSSAKIVTVDSVDALRTKKNLKCVMGESIAFYFDRVEKDHAFSFINKFLKDKKAVFIKEEKGVYGKSLYFFSPLIFEGVKVGNNRANIHIVIGNDKIIMGSPLIFGSF